MLWLLISTFILSEKKKINKAINFSCFYQILASKQPLHSKWKQYLTLGYFQNNKKKTWSNWELFESLEWIGIAESIRFLFYKTHHFQQTNANYLQKLMWIQCYWIQGNPKEKKKHTPTLASLETALCRLQWNVDNGGGGDDNTSNFSIFYVLLIESKEKKQRNYYHKKKLKLEKMNRIISLVDVIQYRFG